ncbi:DUF1481 domain-containing protein [Tatumella sp. JGM100]|nr:MULTISPECIES: DUF1481 domain-containing protein [unclassified Tatumella]MBS0878810.1 DUF1481 domain-containing protein [Tatumella sp. JGM82]MBS0892251.1 DUF1481 domain-containing protein [Tatumella sp. JGM94]MBS0901122.1 DUF1481 domain-containing protein [Tatumella sp. JGM100]
MLFSARIIAIGLLPLLLLAGCSSSDNIPPFSASGYLADRGVVRLWRKNTPPDYTAIRTLYTPFDQSVTEQTDYQWHNGNLLFMQSHITGGATDDVTLRFDNQGKLSFMQRQLQNRRQDVSQQAIELYRFDAGRILKISDALLAGKIYLQQGRWQQNNTVLTCDDQQVQASLDMESRRMIARVRSGTASPVYIAWLKGPEGTQLLRATRVDLCHNQPVAADL